MAEIDYNANPLWLRPGETNEQYTTRTKAYWDTQGSQATSPATAPSSSTSSMTDKILGEISNQLFSSSGMVSSDDLTSTYQGIIDRLNAAQAAREAGLTASLERAKAGVRETGLETLTQARELQRGVGAASSFALINKIEEATNKELKDLDLRYQEALATGQFETAQSISDLQVKAIQTKQEQQQQAYQNMLNAANLALNIGEFQRSAENANATKLYNALNAIKGLNISSMNSQNRRSLETQFGIPVGTLDDINLQADFMNTDAGLAQVTYDGEGNPVVKIVVPSTNKPTSTDVGIEINNLLSSSRGTDGLISAESYMKGYERFASLGGTPDEYVRSYNPYSYMSSDEVDRLYSVLGFKPENLRSLINDHKEDLGNEDLLG
jgi:hypothetical protein